jgi:hypothetical protein
MKELKSAHFPNMCKEEILLVTMEKHEEEGTKKGLEWNIQQSHQCAILQAHSLQRRLWLCTIENLGPRSSIEKVRKIK